jgi:hypothetical protein
MAISRKALSSYKLDDLATPDDNTDLDFSTTKHGLVPKGTDTGAFLKDNGGWGTPTNTTYSSSDFDVAGDAVAMSIALG